MNDRILQTAIGTYGHSNQMAMVQEETAELIEAISIMRHDRSAGRAMVVEEIADVMIMLRQVELMLEAEDEIGQRAAVCADNPEFRVNWRQVEKLAAFICSISKLLRGKKSGRDRVVEKAGEVAALVRHAAADLNAVDEIKAMIDFKINRLAGKIERFNNLKAAA